MIIGYSDSNNTVFAFNIINPEQIEQAKKLIIEGVEAWYQAATEAPEPTAHYTVEDIKKMYYAGYSEPSADLLKRFNIAYKDIDTLTDWAGDIITAAPVDIWL